MAQFNFNTTNFILGFGAGVLTTLAVQRVWRALQAMNTDTERVVARTAAHRTGDRGYLRHLAAYAQRAHLAGEHIRLSEILIEPRFIRPQDMVTLPNDDNLPDVWDAVPLTHDFPFLHAAYNIPTISIDDLSRGDGTLIIAGNPGSGRTTALLSIALWSAGYLEFTPPSDVIQEQQNQADSDLSPKERADRVKKRVALMEKGLQQYKQQQSGAKEKAEDAGIKEEAQQEEISAFRKASPLYIHVANLLPASGEFGRRIDPAEPLLRALQQTVGWFTSRRMVMRTYRLLEAGDAIVLIDGFDDLPMSERPAVMEWMKHFIEIYKQNFIIIAMPTTGYGALMQLGATPVFMRPWIDQSVREATEKWGTNWEKISKQPLEYSKKDFREVTDFYSAVAHNTRCMNTFEITLNLWAYFRGTTSNQGEAILGYLEQFLPDAKGILPDLERMAFLQVEHGYLKLADLIDSHVDETFAQRLGWDAEAPLTTATVSSAANAAPLVDMPTDASAPVDLGALFDEVEAPELEETPLSEADEVLNEFYGQAPEMNLDNTDLEPVAKPSSVEKAAKVKEATTPQRRSIAREQSRILKALVKAGILVPYRNNGYQFRHVQMAAYLAARALHKASPDFLYQKYQHPDWRFVMRYLAQLRDVDFLVAEQLSKPLDVLHESLLELTNWLRYADETVLWRNNLLRYLGNLMLAPHQYTLIRERIAAALLSARDNGAMVIFRRAMQDPNANIRRLGCLGLGMLRDEAAINPLASLAMQDSERLVRIAAAVALGAIGTEDALLAMMDVFEMLSDNDVRRAITETLAANRELGYLTLYDGLKSKDMLIRRASVFGVGRIKTDWALIALNETFLEDDEFYVRVAAQVVFKDIYEASLRGVQPYPKLVEAPWLLQWGQEQIEMGNIPHDTDVDEIFNYALTNKDTPLIRQLATTSIGLVGEYTMLGVVYQALQDGQEAIRDTAYRTLGEFQKKLGKALPSPVGAG